MARIRAAVERHGKHFIDRVYTPFEVERVERRANRFEEFAARFAAKEAGMKAIGTGWRRGVGWRDFEVVNLPSGKPTLRLSGRAAEIAAEMNVTAISISLTHTADYAMAMVVLES